MATGFPLACTTNLQTHTAIYYSRHPTQHTSRTPSHTLNSLLFDVFLVTTLISLRSIGNVPVLQDTRLPRSSDPQQQTPRTVSLFAIGITSHNNQEGGIPLTLTFHQHTSVKNIILKKLKNTSARSHHCRNFLTNTPHFIQTG